MAQYNNALVLIYHKSTQNNGQELVTLTCLNMTNIHHLYSYEPLLDLHKPRYTPDLVNWLITSLISCVCC